MKTFKIGGVAGCVPITMHKLIGFKSAQDLMYFCFGDEEILERITQSVTNTIFFNNVFIQGRKSRAPEKTFWVEAKNHFSLISYSLVNNFDNNTIFQNIHLLVELTLKAVLTNNSISFDCRKGHDLTYLIKLLEAVNEEKQKELLILIKDFPGYVKSRYDGVNKNFLEIINMAVNAQILVGKIVAYTSYDRNTPISLLTSID